MLKWLKEAVLEANLELPRQGGCLHLGNVRGFQG